MSFSPRRAVLLDKDGTLVRNVHYSCDPDQIDFLPGVVEALKLWQARSYALAVATNQGAIAQGHFTEAAFQGYLTRFRELLAGHGVQLDHIYYCPHHPDGRVPTYTLACDCRKPAPGMLSRALADQGVPASQAWFVGDSLTDVQAGRRAGLRTALVDLGHSIRPSQPDETPDLVARHLLHAAHLIVQANGDPLTPPVYPVASSSQFRSPPTASLQVGEASPLPDAEWLDQVQADLARWLEENGAE